MVRSTRLRLLAGAVFRRLTQWRRDLAFYWFAWDKGNVGFVLVLAGLFGTVGSIVYFAYTDHARAVTRHQRQSDLDCLARNIYHEARGESPVGQRAVAEVTLNRVQSPDFPNTVCAVVFENHWDARRKRNVGAFSWTEFDSLARPKGTAWQQALAVARAVYDNEETPVVRKALYYHADYVEPRWAKTKKQVATIGRHIFYE